MKHEYITIPSTWREIATVDLSEPYEVDQHSIFRTDDGFAYAYASGCSCWDGEWDVYQFKTLADVGIFLAGDIEYGPSVSTVSDLMSQAYRNYI